MTNRISVATSALAVGLLILLTAVWATRPLSHDDLFWHMRTAEIVFQDGVVPTTDPFSYTRRGASWVSHEWGFGVLLYPVYAVGGFEGLVVLQVVLILAIIASLGWLLWKIRPATAGAALLITPLLALGLWASFHELKLNAALLTTLFLAWELLLLSGFRVTGRRIYPVCLILLFLFWANVHSGVLFGLILLAFHAFESLIDARKQTGSPQAVAPATYLALLAAAVAVSLANPNGIESPLYPLRLSWFLFASGVHLDMGHFTAPTPADRPGFFLLVALLFMGLVPRHQWKLLRVSESLAVVMFLLLSLRSNRFIFDFVIISLPVVLKLQARIASARLARLVPAGAAAGILLALLASEPLLGKDLLAENIPWRAAAFLEREEISGNILNHQNYGGYIGWRLGIPIFWDGRNEVFGPLMEHLAGTSPDRILEEYAIDHLLITEQEYGPFRGQLSRERWGVVYWDDYCAIFLRRIPGFEKVLERDEYTVIPPFGQVPELRFPGRPDLARRARDELDRAARDNPESQRALYYSGLMSLYEGDLRRAKLKLESASRIRPHEAVDRALLDVLNRLSGRQDPERKS